jgi:hypothetical protein
MSSVVLYMPMSVDAFTTGPDDGMDHGLAASGGRPHDWLSADDEPTSPVRSKPATRGGARWAK